MSEVVECPEGAYRNVERIKVVGIPVDVCRPEDMEGAALELIARDGVRRVMFLTIWELLKARHNKEWRRCIESCDLILPVSKSILKGAAFCKKTVPTRWNPFDAIIQIMSTVEMRRKSLYLLGSRPATLTQAEANVRATFPEISIVGRYAGYYPKKTEGFVVSAINKSAPSLVLLSEGLKDRDLWAYRRRDALNGGIFVYYSDTIGVFSGRIHRMSQKSFERGQELFVELFRNPFKVFYIFSFMWYKVVLLFYRLFRKDA